MALVTLEETRAVIDTALTDAQLSAVIAREEAELIRLCGAHGDGSTAIVERHNGGGADLFLARRPASVTSVAELYLGSTATTLTASQYYLRPGGVLSRLPSGIPWGGGGVWGTGNGYVVTVTYVPEDDRPLRRQVLLELIRIALSQSPYTQETAASAAGSHSYTMRSSWERARANQYARLRMAAV